MKKTYKLYCRTQSISRYDVDAETLEEAIRKLREGGGELQKEECDGMDDPHEAEWVEWEADEPQPAHPHHGVGAKVILGYHAKARGECTDAEIADAIAKLDAE